jgi:two-component system chemotaxis sensor kinase CheA
MPTKDDKLLQRLLATFKVEAQEHVQAIAAGLVELEKAATEETRAAVLESTFRSVHSLKGAARTVSVMNIEALCQSMENVFAALKRRQIDASADLFDVLHQVVDALVAALRSVEAGLPAAREPHIAELVHSLQTLVTAGLSSTSGSMSRPTPREFRDAPAQAPAVIAMESAHADDAPATVRVATTKLDAVLLQAEELLAAKLATTQHAARLRQLRAQPAEWKKRWTKLRSEVRWIRHPPQPQTQLTPILEFLEWSEDCIGSLHSGLLDLAQAADHEQRAIAARVDGLLDEMKRVVMQPFATLLDVFPRFVRELSRDQGKEVELAIRGSDIEIDRRILEKMKDPLIHLVRNCLDHGIETPAVRAGAGKPARGTVTINISEKNGSKVELLIADDGAGIDAGAVKAAAVQAGLLSTDRAATLADQEAVFLVFQPGLSTSRIITDLSGRGLGLAIAKEKVEQLNGAVVVDTQPGKGTAFRIILPLTLARFRGVIVRVEERLFVLPTSSVQRALRVKTDTVKTVENRATIALGGQAVSLVKLADVLEFARRTADQQPQTLQVLVLVGADQRIAFAVDEILDEQEVLVKTLGPQLARVRNVSGATVLGHSEVVPILNVSDLMKSAVQAGAIGSRTQSDPAVPKEMREKSVLVAEDSITSRDLLKNILEAAGYRVETAVDGVDAFTKLRSGAYDLVISDVDMPRLNGFGLTAKIRAEKRFSELPVVLVTALDSRDDRERGIDVGANAYIVKSSFDQSNLLEIVGRLI